MTAQSNNTTQKFNILDLPEEPEDSELDEIDKEIIEMGFIEDEEEFNKN